MKLQIEFAAYNERRYSRPWGGRISSWDNAGKPELDWGAFIGQHGAAGRVEIEARPGDIVRWGQRDNRGNGGINAWGIVEDNGSIRDCTPTQARDHWLSRQSAPAAPPIVRNPLVEATDGELVQELLRRGMIRSDGEAIELLERGLLERSTQA